MKTMRTTSHYNNEFYKHLLIVDDDRTFIWHIDAEVSDLRASPHQDTHTRTGTRHPSTSCSHIALIYTALPIDNLDTSRLFKSHQHLLAWLRCEVRCEQP